MSHIPPDVSKAIASISIRISIDAPVSTVWDVILDFPSYPLWNTFVRSQAITDASFKPLLAHPKPKEGDRILMHVRVPPIGLHDDGKGLHASKDIITMIDEEHHRVGWKLTGMPNWFLRAQRWQEVREEHVDGRTTTTYTSIEAFNGPGAWIIRLFLYKNLKKSFDAMAEGLRTRSEHLVAEGPSPDITQP